MGNSLYFDTICRGRVQTFSINELELDSWALQYLYLSLYLPIYLSICPNIFLDTEYILN